MTLKEAFVYFFQTSLAVEYLHSKGLIHRDIKAENLLLDISGNIKMCDFGGSAQLENPEEARYTYFGTKVMMAPEILSDDGYDEKVDIWALGLIILDMIDLVTAKKVREVGSMYGTRRIEQRDINKQISKLLEKNTEEKMIYRVDLLIEMVKKMLAMDKTKRLEISEVLEHPWVEFMATEFNINIQQYRVSRPKSRRNKSMSGLRDQKNSQKRLNYSKSQKENFNKGNFSTPSFANNELKFKQKDSKEEQDGSYGFSSQLELKKKEIPTEPKFLNFKANNNARSGSRSLIKKTMGKPPKGNNTSSVKNLIRKQSSRFNIDQQNIFKRGSVDFGHRLLEGGKIDLKSKHKKHKRQSSMNKFISQLDDTFSSDDDNDLKKKEGGGGHSEYGFFPKKSRKLIWDNPKGNSPSLSPRNQKRSYDNRKDKRRSSTAAILEAERKTQKVMRNYGKKIPLEKNISKFPLKNSNFL